MASKTQTDPLPPSPDLIRDLLDPALTSVEVMQRHTLDPQAFRAAVRSEAFREATEALRDADVERTELLTPLMHARALHTLSRIANQPTTTPAQTESARRASTALLKLRPHSEPSSRGADFQSASRAQPEPPTPSPTPNPTPNPNPLADITGDPTMTFEDSLRLIAEIEALRRGLPLPGGTGVPPVLPDLATMLSPAAQLTARAGLAP